MIRNEKYTYIQYSYNIQTDKCENARLPLVVKYENKTRDSKYVLSTFECSPKL